MMASAYRKCQNSVMLQPLWVPLAKVMTASRQEQTKISYDCAYKAFSNWCKTTNQSDMPASAETIALYLVSLVQCGRSKATLNKAFYAINWFHNLTGVNYNACEKSAWLKLCLEGCCRIVARPVKKKEPLTVDTLKAFVKKFASTDCSLSDLRITTLVLISFAGFLRFREAIKIRRSDIDFFPSYCSIFISESKTDVYRMGNKLVVARTGSAFCPVRMLERYISAIGASDRDSDEYIFRAVMYDGSSKVQKLRPNHFKYLSYSTVRAIFLRMLSELGLNAKDYGLHSLRSGGATISANRGTPDRLWKRHGRWVSETAKDGYVADDLQHRLSVTLGLGL